MPYSYLFIVFLFIIFCVHNAVFPWYRIYTQQYVINNTILHHVFGVYCMNDGYRLKRYEYIEMQSCWLITVFSGLASKIRWIESHIRFISDKLNLPRQSEPELPNSCWFSCYSNAKSFKLNSIYRFTTRKILCVKMIRYLLTNFSIFKTLSFHSYIYLIFFLP